jgi:hypothetical protein
MLETRFIVVVALSALLCSTGCGKSDGLVDVSGVVTLDGQPMSGVHVLFDQPELGPRENKGYVGRTDATGRYTLSPALEEASGVAPGTYRVSLTTSVTDPSAPAPKPPPGKPVLFYPEEAPPPPERVPRAYRGGKLSFTVTEEGTDQANFDLKSR